LNQFGCGLCDRFPSKEWPGYLFQGGKEAYRITWNTGGYRQRRDQFFEIQESIKVSKITDAEDVQLKPETQSKTSNPTTQGGRIAFNYRKIRNQLVKQK